MPAFAAWRYRNIFQSAGGPISKTHVRKVGSSFEAYAYLDSSLCQWPSTEHFVYGQAHGTGTATLKSIAMHIAISEALERWACLSLRYQHSKSYGMEIDFSSTGFAAMPSLFSSGARDRALLEATERWAICAWWEGYLSASAITQNGEIDTILIDFPSKIRKVVVLHAISPIKRCHAYGFGAGNSIKSATSKAKTELFRNFDVLDRIEIDHTKHIENIFERRLIFFSKEQGFKRFEDKLNHHARVSSRIPKLVVDSSIPGPWQKYAWVWRCLFEPLSANHISSDIEYFLF